jgi:hypothetical protein
LPAIAPPLLDHQSSLTAGPVFGVHYTGAGDVLRAAIGQPQPTIGIDHEAGGDPIAGLSKDDGRSATSASLPATR